MHGNHGNRGGAQQVPNKLAIPGLRQFSIKATSLGIGDLSGWNVKVQYFWDGEDKAEPWLFRIYSTQEQHLSLSRWIRHK